MSKLNNILKLKEEGLTTKEIADKLNYKSHNSLTACMRKYGYGYSKEKDTFIKKSDNDNLKDTKELINNDIKKNTKVIKKNTNITNKKESIKEVNHIEKQLNEILKIIKNNQKETLKVEPIELNYIIKSLKVDKDTIERFDKYCKKYSGVTKAYILTKAIDEFLKKYDNE